MKKNWIIIVSAMLISGCKSSDVNKNKMGKWAPKYQIEVGANKGGIIENTDFTLLPEVLPDAFSGATKTGANIGIHTVLPLRHNAVQLGLVYMYNQQIFTYNDVKNNHFGKRKLDVSQVMLPTTFNIGLFRKNYPQGLFQLKFGHVLLYNLIDITNTTDQLPNYSYNRWSNGFTFGISTIPYSLKNGMKLGAYFNIYRGSQIFTDFYNQPRFEMPGSSYLSYGIVMQF